MAKTKQARWVCPRCEHGRLAPTRPRRDDVRRYCLPCSEATGRLVERMAPALERKREARSEALADRRKRKTQRERERQEAYFTVDGINLEREMRRLCRLKAFRKSNGKPMKPPKLIVKRMSKQPSTRYGWCKYWERTICVIAYPGITKYDALETLLHELVHNFEGRSDYDVHPAHGDFFKRRFRDAMKEAYGVSYLPDNAYHGRLATLMRQFDRSPDGMRFLADNLDESCALMRQELPALDDPVDVANYRKWIRRDTESARRLRLRADEVDRSTHHVLQLGHTTSAGDQPGSESRR